MKVLNSGELLLGLVLILLAITFVLRYFIKSTASNELNTDSAHYVELEREKRHEIIYQHIIDKKALSTTKPLIRYQCLFMKLQNALSIPQILEYLLK